jgi:prepilin-type processing-associated H-X9-DG protein
MKQLGIGILMYHEDNNDKIPYANVNGSIDGWDGLVRGYLSSKVASGFWDSTEKIDSMRCPSSQQPKVIGSSYTGTYAMPAGNAADISMTINNVPHYGYRIVSGSPYRKINDLPDPTGTLALTEVDTSSGASRQGLGFFTHRADFQTNDGANGSSNDGSSNTTLKLHNKSNVNNLLADGHVESLYPLSTKVVGAAGPSSAWDGMWSVTAGD